MRIRRVVSRIFDRSCNEIRVGKDSTYSVDSTVKVDHCSAKINGCSQLIISKGARVSNTRFQIDGNSSVVVGPDCVIENLDICLWAHSSLQLGDRCKAKQYRFVEEEGIVNIGPDNVLSDGEHTALPTIRISHGELAVEDHNNLSVSIWIRFGGKTKIGRYNCINNGTEIRCDEEVTVGSFNMISYLCDIWDTNTHVKHALEEKKTLFEKDFPHIGRETEKPETRPIHIGDGNWIGKRACILKGSRLGNEITVGTRAIVSNQHINDGTTIVCEKGRVVE